MPQEVIHPSTPQFSEGPPIRLRAVVGWTRELDAQIGLQVEDAENTLADLLFGDQALLQTIGLRLLTARGVEGHLETDDGRLLAEEAGAEVIGWLRDARDYVERDGVWMSLDRRQINALIRRLRRARDEAYGRDE